MGTPIPPRVRPPLSAVGIPCGDCWGPFRTFGDIPTPSQVQVTVSGINIGPNWVPSDGPPINGVLILPQVTGRSCSFWDDVEGWRVGALLFVQGGNGFIANALGHIMFSSAVPVSCGTYFENAQNDRFTGGSMLFEFGDTF